MRDVDFLPEWYKENTRRKISVQRQYIALSIIFLIMIFSNAIATRKISRANADLTASDQERGQAERFMVEFGRLNSRVSETRSLMTSAHRLKLELDVANILAELSTVVSGETVLESVRLVSLQQTDRDASAESAAPSAEEAERDAQGFKVRLMGFAGQASHVAALIAELEHSMAFDMVNLVYSKACTEGDGANLAEDAAASEASTSSRIQFEIECAIAKSADIEDVD